MRILIQNPENRGYFDGAEWRLDVLAAKEFESVYQAEAFCNEHGINRALIVVKFNNAASQDITYAVGAANAPLVSKPPTTKLYRRFLS